MEIGIDRNNITILWHFTRCAEFSKGLMCLSTSAIIPSRNSTGTVENHHYSPPADRTYACAMTLSAHAQGSAPASTQA